MYIKYIYIYHIYWKAMTNFCSAVHKSIIRSNNKNSYRSNSQFISVSVRKNENYE